MAWLADGRSARDLITATILDLDKAKIVTDGTELRAKLYSAELYAAAEQQVLRAHPISGPRRSPHLRCFVFTHPEE